MTPRANVDEEATAVDLQADSLYFACSDVDSTGLVIQGTLVGEEDNIQADPIFCDSAEDFHLADTSPCAPGNSPPGCGLIGALGVGCVIGVDGVDPAASIRQQIAIRPPAPNPTSSATRIEFGVPSSSTGERVVLRIYDPAGRLVRTLVEAPLAAGGHAVTWDGRDEQGHAVPAGAYFLKLSASRRTVTERLVMVR